MVAVANVLRLAGYALGALGGALVFIEFFQLPSYVEFHEEFRDYSVDTKLDDASEYTWFGRVGAFCIALAFSLLFVAAFLGS
ncbi:hypothetical protein [Salinirarus marinus]|uniref:hypothetical protein n=1 Tax=Salinirarus marinus TaxID=3068310 RepID=UPI003C6C5E05